MSTPSITLENPYTRRYWQRLIGTVTLPIRTPVPQQRKVNGTNQPVYVLAEQALTPRQRIQLVKNLAQAWCRPRGRVQAWLEREGMAILCADGKVASPCDGASHDGEGGRGSEDGGVASTTEKEGER